VCEKTSGLLTASIVSDCDNTNKVYFFDPVKESHTTFSFKKYEAIQYLDLKQKINEILVSIPA